MLTTERLTIEKFTLDDAPFIFKLVNEPSWIQFIGDKGVKNLEDAKGYLLKGPMDSYEKWGYGLYKVSLKDSNIPIGMCGFVNRPTLEDVDIGFAFFPTFGGKGYAFEAAAAMMKYGKETLGFSRVVAITSPDNVRSIRLLEKIGLRFDKMIDLPPYDEPGKFFVPVEED